MTTDEMIHEIFRAQMLLEVERGTADVEVSNSTRLQEMYNRGALDSLGMVEITLALEDQFELEITDAHQGMFEANPEVTINDVVAYIKKRLAGQFVLGIGIRVKVALKDTTGWHKEGAKSMNGAVGTITVSHSTIDAWNRPCPPNYVVTFDEPCAPWHSHQDPVRAFHFGENELELVT